MILIKNGSIIKNNQVIVIEGEGNKSKNERGNINIKVIMNKKIYKIIKILNQEFTLGGKDVESALKKFLKIPLLPSLKVQIPSD